jgi:hypothetical protein
VATTYVHGYDEYVESKELPDHAASFGALEDVEEIDGFPNINTGDDKLLQSDGCHLEVFNVEVCFGKCRIFGKGGSKVEDNNSWEDEDGGGEYHPFNSAKNLVVIEYQTEPGVEDNGLTSDHEHPANVVDGPTEREGTEAEVSQHQSKDVENDAKVAY